MSNQMVSLSPRNILFLRVGIDTGSGGTLGPIFVDGTFEYVPIPENPAKVSPRSVLYKALPARSGGMLAQFVPKRYRDGAAHYDPEFESYTYGDPTVNKRRQLLRLSDGDFLVFYAGLRPHRIGGDPLLYVIGYFIVRNVHAIPNAAAWPPAAYAFLCNNAHLRRSTYDPGLVIIEGRRDRGGLLSKAVPISDAYQKVIPEITNIIGFKGSIKRAIGRWVPTGNLSATMSWLNGLV